MIALVVGSAACVWDDLRATHGVELGAVIAVNRMIRDYAVPPTYGVSVHHEHAKGFRREGVPMVSTRLVDGVDVCYDEKQFHHGTSGLYAVGWALRIGAERVICAGIPLDLSPHYYPGPGIGPDIAVYQDPWRQCLDTMRGRVFSLSGWTRELLGPPQL